MKKIILFLISICISQNIFAQSSNFYAWIINNSTNKTIEYSSLNDYGGWDNFGWFPCNGYLSASNTVAPGSSILKCGGTNRWENGGSGYGWFMYGLSVLNNNSVIYSINSSWDNHSQYPANLSIKNGSGGIAKEIKITTTQNDDKDAVILYIFDDNGFSTVVTHFSFSDYANKWNYTKSINLLGNRCLDQNGCSIYTSYK